MVERIMLLKLQDSSEGRELAYFVRSTLLGLEGVEEVSVGLPADVASEKSWDVSVVMLFVSEATQSITLASEGFSKFMAHVAGKAQVVKAWSFERLG